MMSPRLIGAGSARWIRDGGAGFAIEFYSSLRLNFGYPRSTQDARQVSSGDAIKIYNEQGEFGARAHVTDDVPPGVVWIRDG